MTDSIVIVGGGQAGAQSAITLRQNGYEGSILILGEEPFIPYERPPLSKQFLAGEVGIEQLYMRNADFYTDKTITIESGSHVSRIDRKKKTVEVVGGKLIPYSKLILATGGRVRKMNCPGADLPGIHYLRGISDVEQFRDKLDDRTRLVIVGADT